MIMATIDYDTAEFRLQDGRMLRVIRITPEDKYKIYFFDRVESEWVESFPHEGWHSYRDALAELMHRVHL